VLTQSYAAPIVGSSPGCDLCERPLSIGRYDGKRWNLEGRICTGCRNELLAEARQKLGKSTAASKVKPCAACGDTGGEVSRLTGLPKRFDASPYDIDGEVCEACRTKNRKRLARIEACEREDRTWEARGIGGLNGSTDEEREHIRLTAEYIREEHFFACSLRLRGPRGVSAAGERDPRRSRVSMDGRRKHANRMGGQAL